MTAKSESSKMPSLLRLRGLDVRAWRAATLSAPFVIQLILGMLLIAMWLLGKWPFNTHSAHAGERAWLLTATAITTLGFLLISPALLRSPSPRMRGLALSISSCAVVVLVGGVIFAFLMLR